MKTKKRESRRSSHPHSRRCAFVPRNNFLEECFMKRYFTVVSMVCLFALAGIAGATAQEAQKANPATDFEYDLNESGDGVVIYKYKGRQRR